MMISYTVSIRSFRPASQRGGRDGGLDRQDRALVLLREECPFRWMEVLRGYAYSSTEMHLELRRSDPQAARTRHRRRMVPKCSRTSCVSRMVSPDSVVHGLDNVLSLKQANAGSGRARAPIPRSGDVEDVLDRLPRVDSDSHRDLLACSRLVAERDGEPERVFMPRRQVTEREGCGRRNRNSVEDRHLIEL